MSPLRPSGRRGQSASEDGKGQQHQLRVRRETLFLIVQIRWARRLSEAPELFLRRYKSLNEKLIFKRKTTPSPRRPPLGTDTPQQTRGGSGMAWVSPRHAHGAHRKAPTQSHRPISDTLSNIKDL